MEINSLFMFELRTKKVAHRDNVGTRGGTEGEESSGKAATSATDNRDICGVAESASAGSVGSDHGSHSSSLSSTPSQKTIPFFNPSFDLEDGRTMSSVFREKYGENAVDRVYGFTTESLDYLKAHPDLMIPGPNPQRIPHDEIMNALTGFTNMVLAHEIAVNDDFRLERYVPNEEL